MATFVPRFLRQLRDVVLSSPADGEVLAYDDASGSWINSAAAGGGVTDHGALTGLADNDHPQYQLASGAATDLELAAAIAGLSSVYQPLDSDVTALAALTTTAFGRGLLELANQAALLSAAGAAAASHVHAGEDVTSGTVADARIAATIARDSEVTAAISALSSVYQPLDSDLTAIAALTTTAFGRSVLALADQAALLAAAGAAAASHAHAGEDVTSGTVADARVASTITRDSEVASLAALVKLDDFAAPDDNTDLDASTAKHGLLKKLPGGTTTFLRADGSFATPTAAVNVTYETRSTNTILAGADNAKSIDITAAITQTFTAAATLGAGWWVILRNATQTGTVAVVLDPNSTELVDGLATLTMYSGETRLVMCTGSAFVTQLLQGGYAKFTPGSSTFVVPTGIVGCRVVCIGAGGQGGGGASSVSTAKGGGSGGGGGGVAIADFRPADLGAAGASITVTVGAGGSAAGGGAGAGAGAAGTAGSDGAQTTFGAFLKAGGGGGGPGGTNSNQIAGAGGALTSAAGSTPGVPGTGGVGITTGVGTCATVGASGGNGLSTEFGGACGGGGNTTGVRTGGSSIYAGPGGGSGGHVAVGNTGATGGIGGATQSYAAGGGAAGGTGGASTTLGASGTQTGPYCGTGAGGGGSGNADVAPKAGGVGGIGGGGGGGGSACSASSAPAGGAGGAGGAGECRVFYS